MPTLANLRRINPEGPGVSVSPYRQQPWHPTSIRSKAPHLSRVLPPLHSINVSPEGHHHSKRLLSRISEEFDLESTADEMTFVEHNDFQQGSVSNEPQQRPQYYGSGLGDASLVEDDDDYEYLLDEALARDGLYRGMVL